MARANNQNSSSMATRRFKSLRDPGRMKCIVAAVVSMTTATSVLSCSRGERAEAFDDQTLQNIPGISSTESEDMLSEVTSEENEDTADSGSNSDDSDIAQSDSETASDDTQTQHSTEDDGVQSDSESGIKFDIEVVDFPTQEERCTKIDFLFVVDNSRSMEDEQTQLRNAFPQFIGSIREQVGIEDYQLMVVDSDTRKKHTGVCLFGVCQCSPDPGCCSDVCADNKPTMCNGKNCSTYPTFDGCDDALGVGLVRDSTGKTCDGAAAGDRRFFVSDPHTDLSDAFSCAATVGTQGDPDERLMEAMLRSVLPEMTDPGACNAGFLRDDALLVVTFITDEEDKAQRVPSPGTPQIWHDALVGLKGDAGVVVVGFYGDTDQASALCKPLNESTNKGAQAGVRLREFVSLFGDRGLSASVCQADYGPTFMQALSIIDTACEDWLPK